MNTLKSKNELSPKEAAAFVEHLVSENFLSLIQEPWYPETRKDVCLIKATLLDMQSSFDILFLVWKSSGEIKHVKLWGTTIYDPPSQKHLMIGYMIEEKKSLIIKVYPTDNPANNVPSQTGTIFAVNKEKLGL